MDDSPHNPLINADLAPVSLEDRTWSSWNIAALWIGMAVCIPTYMLAAGMVKLGMNWWQATLTVMAGNMIVLVPMILNGHAGTKLGVPFPVLVRASFGINGAHIPSIARSLVACGWFGIQTWIGGAALYTILGVLGVFDPALDTNTLPVLGITAIQFASFLAFWAIHVVIVIKGVESIKVLETWAAPFLIASGVALLIWALLKVDRPAELFSSKTNYAEGSNFWKVFFPQLTAMVGFWATLSLNIPDFTRYSKSQKDQVVGQLIGLPPTMTLFCFIGIIVTGATVIIFGEAIWNPVDLVAQMGSPTIVVISMIALLIATLSTNLAANVVSPANGFSNIAPTKISFRLGGIITCIIGVLIMPWRLISDTQGYIFTWLIGYSALIGPIVGIMLCDYFLIRKTNINTDELYKADGEFKGVNWRAMITLIIAVLPNIPGFINAATNRTHDAYESSTKALEAARENGMNNAAIQAAFDAKELIEPQTPIFAQSFDAIYTYAWFVGVLISVVLYYLLMKTKSSINT
ncbi:MAG: NCS1 family nucleobase:cation symporter-1 [Phycisphaerales bacterium]|nr:NCS1 family nucleobase:cation symporter-1 [Phycisphaerales bacterium]